MVENLRKERVGACGSKRLAELALRGAHGAMRQRKLDCAVDELFRVDTTQILGLHGINANDLIVIVIVVVEGEKGFSFDKSEWFD
jgi:hypothetical protein